MQQMRPPPATPLLHCGKTESTGTARVSHSSDESALGLPEPAAFTLHSAFRP